MKITIDSGDAIRLFLYREGDDLPAHKISAMREIDPAPVIRFLKAEAEFEAASEWLETMFNRAPKPPSAAPPDEPA